MFGPKPRSIFHAIADAIKAHLNEIDHIVLSDGRGSRLHHFAYTVPEVRDLIHASDVAVSVGCADRMECGPGRHRIGNALFVYLRDPDGHRIELFNSHYQTIDPGDAPQR